MVTIKINGQQVEAEQGQMLIEAADSAGITIPRFCYHKNLSIAASCRMCLVEVEKAPKPMPACATPVADGMVVNTKSTYALAAQKSVMEFLLINHPLDCPVCDQGGECDLQDFSIGYGDDKSRYAEIKRVVQDKNIGPLIATELTRCIHCTRCVRFGQEIAGMRELGATGRGDWMEIGTYVEKSVDSELSGNIIDLCPVGSLTSKVSRFTYRVWELNSNDSIGLHDCVGSNCNVQTKNGEIKRVIGRQNDAINDAWISDRDRYSYEGIHSADRVKKPLIKKKDQWTEVSWDEALQYAVNGLKAISEKNQIGSICSPSVSTEEMFLLEKLMRGMGCDNIDHRLRQTDFDNQQSEPLFPGLNMSVSDMSAQQAILLIGSNVRKEQPIMGHQIRQASLKGAKVACINPVAFDFNFDTTEQFIVAPAQLFKELKAFAKAVIENTNIEVPEGLNALIASVKVSDAHQQVVADLCQAENSVIVLGTLLQAMPHYSAIKMLASFIARASQSKLSYLTPGANTTGAYFSGLLPYRTSSQQSTQGLDTQAMFAQQLKGYVLYGLEAEHDIEQPQQALKALNNADFVVSLNSYVTDTMKQYSDVILPVSALTESSGTWVNVDASWQSFAAVSKSPGIAKPGWKVLRVLGNLFDIDGFEQQNSEDVLNELKALLPESSSDTGTMEWHCPDNINAQFTGLQRIAELSIHNVDGITRRAVALQQTQDAQVNNARVNSSLAKKLKLEDGQQVVAKQGDYSTEVTMLIDDTIADDCVYLPAACQAASSLGGGFETIELLSTDTSATE